MSACIDGLALLRANLPMSIVGEPAGAGFNAFGDADVGSIDFPRTGLHLFVSSLRHDHSDSDDLRAFTPVDVPALPTFRQYISGRDEALDPILANQEMRSLVEIARADGASAASAAYDGRYAKYGKLDWWAPAEKDDLNTLGNDLRRARKVQEAVAVLRLNTKIFSDWWNSWDSLGEAQLAAGEFDAARESYLHALELNPNDEFAKAALRPH